MKSRNKIVENLVKSIENNIDSQNKLNRIEHNILYDMKHLIVNLEERQKLLAKTIVNLKKAGDIPPEQVTKLEEMIENGK